MAGLLVAAAVLGVLGIAATAALCAVRVRRLHRLHVRLDAARAGLDLALARRAAAAAAAGVAAPGAGAAPAPRSGRAVGGDPNRLGAIDRGLAAEPDRDPQRAGEGTGVRREEAANELARRLARLDRDALAPDVRAALAEAEVLLVLARRVHNDAVRDTLGLRSRRLVRWLRLAGTAPMPAYFETAEPSADRSAAVSVRADDATAAGGDAVTSGTPARPPA